MTVDGRDPANRWESYVEKDKEGRERAWACPAERGGCEGRKGSRIKDAKNSSSLTSQK
jgi:hypothetical protein